MSKREIDSFVKMSCFVLMGAMHNSTETRRAMASVVSPASDLFAIRQNSSRAPVRKLAPHDGQKDRRAHFLPCGLWCRQHF